MKKKVSAVWKFRFLGSIIAVTGSAISSIVFYITDTLCLIIFSPDIHLADMINIGYLNFEIIIGIFLITLLPALLGGSILAYLQQREASRKRFSTLIGGIQGGILGFLAGLICVSGVSGFFILIGNRIPARIAILIHVINALVIATLSGMWTGSTLSKRMKRDLIGNSQSLEKG